MDQIRARMPWEFFEQLYPFNIEPLKGNAMCLRACGFAKSDSTLLRSKEYVLFGHGLLTMVAERQRLIREHPLIPESQIPNRDLYRPEGYALDIVQMENRKGVVYWRADASSDQAFTAWQLRASIWKPVPDDGIHFVELVSIDGLPGQFVYVFRSD